MIVVIIVAILMVLHTIMNTLGWVASKQDLQLYFGEAPFNWRAVTGPWLYIAWLYARKSKHESG